MTDWRQTLLPETATIRDAIESLDTTGSQIVMIVDEKDKLLGTITDGDIRRAILRGGALEETVSAVMFREPTIAHAGDSRDSILSIIRTKLLHQIPVVDDDGRVVALETVDGLIQESHQESWVVLMAGGLGSRLSPLTDDTPKPLLAVGNKPILETILDGLASHGFRRVFIAVNYRADMVMDHFGDGADRGLEISYLREDKRLGTAGALSLLPEIPSTPLLVMNGDLLTNLNFGHLLTYHREHENKATVCVREETTQIPYGVVEVADNRIVSLEEKPIHRHYINAGIYALDPAALALVPTDSYFDMTSLIAALMEKDEAVSVFPIREFWMDIGRRDDFDTANEQYERHFK